MLFEIAVHEDDFFGVIAGVGDGFGKVALDAAELEFGFGGLFDVVEVSGGEETVVFGKAVEDILEFDFFLRRDGDMLAGVVVFACVEPWFILFDRAQRSLALRADPVRWVLLLLRLGGRGGEFWSIHIFLLEPLPCGRGYNIRGARFQVQFDSLSGGGNVTKLIFASD